MKFRDQDVRSFFPALDRQVRGRNKLVYLDSAASYLKPRPVVDALFNHYLEGASNIHRGVHQLSEEATYLYEGTREKIRKFINAPSKAEIIFTSGTTDSINMVARSWADRVLSAGDEILITEMEHHSNIVPWQLACGRSGAILKVAPMNDRGELILEEFERLLSPRTRIAAFCYVSNSLGTINPVQEMIRIAKSHGAITVIDGAQAVAHLPVDVRDLDCDFLAFSAHKMCGASGVGVLYGKRALLEAMDPVKGGGDMIKSVTFEKTTFADLPAKHEAGTPPIGATIAFGAALDFLSELGLENIHRYENELLDYGTSALSQIPGLRVIGTAKNKAAVLSFVVEGVHPHDMGSILDGEGIAVRAGHHCTQPVMKHFKIPATTRASLAFYNNKDDIDALVRGIRKAQDLFA